MKAKVSKSTVLSYFGFEPDDKGRVKQEDIAICWHCKKGVSAKGSNTSNLLTHLQIWHPALHTEVKKAVPAASQAKVPSLQHSD